MRAYMHASVRDVFAIYDNNIFPKLIMIIIKMIIAIIARSSRKMYLTVRIV